MLIINGEYEVALKIDGEELNLDDTVFSGIQIYETATEAVPTCKLVLRDTIEDSRPLRVFDGALVELSYKSMRAEDDQATYASFRVFQIEVEPETSADKVTVWCYYDAPDYFKDAGFEFIEGMSSDVARELATLSNLTPDVDAARDSQIWIRHGLTGYLWLLQTARAAYLDDQSAYVAAVTRTGNLRYYNLGKRRNEGPKWVFISSDRDVTSLRENEIHVGQFSTKIDSGVFNRFAGYGNLSREFNICTGIDGSPSDIAMKNIDKSTDKIQVNRELTKPPRYDGSPWNIGNVHDNYTKALLQNQRILSTFSTNQRVAASQQKDVQLLDRVELQVHARTGPRERLRDFMDGLYFVDRIATHIEPSAVKFYYNLCREGFNSRQAYGGLL